MSSSMRCRRGVIDAPLQTGLIDSRRVPRSVARSAGQIIEKSGCVVEGRSVALPATAKRFSPMQAIPFASASYAPPEGFLDDRFGSLRLGTSSPKFDGDFQDP